MRFLHRYDLGVSQQFKRNLCRAFRVLSPALLGVLNFDLWFLKPVKHAFPFIPSFLAPQRNFKVTFPSQIVLPVSASFGCCAVPSGNRLHLFSFYSSYQKEGSAQYKPLSHTQTWNSWITTVNKRVLTICWLKIEYTKSTAFLCTWEKAVRQHNFNLVYI